MAAGWGRRDRIVGISDEAADDNLENFRHVALSRSTRTREALATLTEHMRDSVQFIAIQRWRNGASE